MNLLLKDVRLAFPAIFEAESVNGGEAKFSAGLLLPTDHPQLAEIRAALVEVAKNKWGAKAKETYDKLEATDKLALHDGNLKAEYDGFADMLYINASNSVRPTIVDRDRTPLVQADGKPYGGCYINASIELWAQDNKFGKRINASLRGVQFLRDGDAFSGGGAAAADEFDDLSDGAGAAAGGDLW